MRTISHLGLFLAACTAVPVTAAPPVPIALHPENPHYFEWHGQPTILITSGEHYGAVLNLDFDYVPYLEELAAHGLNLTRTFSGTYREIPSSFGITDNPLAPKPNRYICPWARSDQPGYFDAGNKFDLERWDEAYFRRLRDFMAQASRHGVVVELNLFCPMYNDQLWQACPMYQANNVNRVGNCDRNQVYTLEHQDLTAVQVAFTKKVVQELNEFDNLYYEVCNEPYAGRVTMEWQHKIVDTIVQTEAGLPHKHLISLNISNGREKVERPHPAVSIFNFHYCVPPDTVALNYSLNKVIGENETGFRGKADVLYRTEAWDFIIAGGGLYNNLDYSFTPGHPGGTFQEYKSPGGGSKLLRGQLRILKDFMASLQFVRMKPDDDVIRSVEPGMSARALVEAGKAYAIYMHLPIPNKPEDPSQLESRQTKLTLALDLPAGSYRAEWVNTRTGGVDKQQSFEHQGGAKRLDSPEFTTDLALRVLR